jgi:glycosyltransferase involved in cell wall biosynthesis
MICSLYPVPLAVMVVAVVIPDQLAQEEYAAFVETATIKLAAKFPMHRFCLFSASTPHRAVPENGQWVKKPGTRNMVSRWWWYHLRLPRLLKHAEADVFVAAEGYCSLRTSCPQCLFWPYGFFSPLKEGFPNLLRRKAHLKKAKTLVVFTEDPKAWGDTEHALLREKTCIVPAAVPEYYVPLDSTLAESVREQYAAGAAYFFCTGIREPASLMMVLKAFSRFKKRQKSSMKLVVPATHLDGASMDQQLAGYRFRQDVVLLPAVDTVAEALLYGASYAVVDLATDAATTLVKALRSQVPVLTAAANNSFTAGAALHFQDLQELGEQMMRVYKDEDLRTRLIEQGKARAALYTWEKCTTRMWQCITAAVNK